MCGTSASADRLLVVHEARVAADELVERCLGLPVAKAINLATRAGFDRAVALLAARLRRATGRADADAVREAIAVLDVDWSRTTAAERRRLVAEAMSATGRATAIVPARIEAPFNNAAQEVVAATRAEARRGQRLAIGAEFNALDQRVVAHVTRSQGNFVRDEYGRRIEGFGEEARRIVAAGLEEDLGRDDIAAGLERAARAALVDRAPLYWETVASAFISHGRSYAQMSSYAEAGIRQYRIEAVLDEQTTNICRYLHGKTLSVADALRRFDRIEQLEDPEAIKQAMPWVRESRAPETGRTRLYVDGGAGRTDLAEVARSALGTRDDRGDFRALASDSALNEVGIGFPPYHGLCRTTTLAVV
ncbi:head morphogenesis protein [Corallococcus exiguus]|uniref:head morphogenesis protein n=1 Tax=Corallococcus exiguus TaxID=83462 RepID=UPI0014722867|nr:head morphogenesis protein [Corallococcus exiguus]NNB92488.1 head morphogenesis protein [Corallococcus exiguus]NNC01306.1 head morphogenesis protein [Corallococcus exiguus]